MLINTKESQLVLIDYQAKLMPAIFEAEFVTQNALKLAKAAKILNIKAFATEQNPSRLGQNPPEMNALCQSVLSKMHFSACEEGLSDWLRPPAKPAQGNARSLPRHLQKNTETEAERSQIVIAGCEAHVCLLQTALHLLEDEFDLYVVVDACSSRTERNRDAAFDRLAGAGAELVTTEMVLFEWLQTAENPQFKTILELIK